MITLPDGRSVRGDDPAVGLLRSLEGHDLNLGGYATVVQPGVMSVGDAVQRQSAWSTGLA